MKKTLSVFVVLLITAPAFAQVNIINPSSRSPIANGIGNAFGGNQQQQKYNMPTTVPAYETQGTHIKTLEERRQDRVMMQNQQLQKSGINIQQIPMQQQGVMYIQLQNVQAIGQQHQGNGNMPGLQPNGAPVYNGTMQ